MPGKTNHLNAVNDCYRNVNKTEVLLIIHERPNIQLYIYKTHYVNKNTLISRNSFFCHSFESQNMFSNATAACVIEM